jgi:hypothetical protein
MAPVEFDVGTHVVCVRNPDRAVLFLAHPTHESVDVAAAVLYCAAVMLAFGSTLVPPAVHAVATAC